MKTALEWFDELPPPIAERAKRACYSPTDTYHSLSDAIMGFYWGDTDERWSFWDKAHSAAFDPTRYQYPSVKQLS